MNKINNYSPNFTGRFVVKGKLSPQNKALLERFKNHVQDGISNKALIAKHNFNVYVDNIVDNRVKKTGNFNPNRIVLFSKFNFIRGDQTSNIIQRRHAERAKLYREIKNLVLLNPEHEDLDMYTQRFRKNLRNVEFSKQYYFGFNSVSELIGKCIKGLFLMVK